MKTTSVAVPLIVVVAGGIWLANQFLTIAGLNDQNTQLQKSLLTADNGIKVPNRPLVTKTALDKTNIDWAEIARQLKLAQAERGGYLKSTARLDAQFIAMTRDELLAALDEIEMITLSNDARELLEKRIFSELVGPKGSRKLAMDRFVSRYEGGGWRWTLAACFSHWIDDEPDQAISWLQQHAKELGSPDELVSQSFYPRLISDPATATRILTALPEEKRLRSLGKLGLGHLPADQQVAWVKIVRAHTPEKDHPKALTWLTMNWSDGDGSRMSMAEVSAYLDRVEATRAEREACILLAMEEGASMGEIRHDNSLPAAERIEILRGWVTAQTPHLIDQATGKGLLGLVGRGGTTYADAAELALSYYEQNPSDELLIPLLDRSSGDESRPSARIMAARLSDETLRRKYMEKHK